MPKPLIQKPHSFTETQVKVKAYELWQQRGSESLAEDNWNDAIRFLKREQVIKQAVKPVRRLWWKTGLGLPMQRWWQWTGIQEKKGWDFVQLLAVPLVLSLLGWGLNEYARDRDYRQQQADKEKEHTQQQADKEKELLITDNKVRQDVLVKYLDQMADSIKDDLLQAKPGDKQYIVAQSRTVLALQLLDKTRQSLVIQFLQASGLNQVDKRTKLDKDGNVQFKAGDKVLLYKAQMSKANLANSDLSGSVLIRVDLSHANLGCLPPESKDRSQCSDLSYANLSGANLSSANLRGANLIEANLEGANLDSADLRGADLTGFIGGANLEGANLGFADLSESNFQESILINANLNWSLLSKTNLEGAILKGANFNFAILSETNLSSSLEDVSFLSAILLATDLRDARDLTPQQLERKHQPPLLCNVALPKGIKVDPDRDCKDIPQVLFDRYRGWFNFKTLKDAEDAVNQIRQKRWKPKEQQGK